MNDPKAMLLRILDIIGYFEDKEKFATEFLQNVSLQALLGLHNTLPQDKKDQLQQKIATIGSDAAKMQEELKAYFNDLQIEQAVENSAKNAVTLYMKAIDPTLSDLQRQNLASYFSEISNNASLASV